MQNKPVNKLLVMTILFLFTGAILIPSTNGNHTLENNDIINIEMQEPSHSPLDYEYKNFICFIKGEATNTEFSSNPDQKICIWNTISFWPSWPEPSFGSLLTIGLNGIQTFNERSFCGITFADGVHGFTGTKQKLSEEPDPHGYTYSFSGFAIRVKVMVMGV